MLSYIFSAYDKSKYKNFFEAYKWEFGLIASTLLILLPLITQSYLFYDDYWAFFTKPSSLGISLGRPLNSLMGFALPSINPGNTYVLRWISVTGLVLFSLCLFKWLYRKTENRLLSFIITNCICLLSALIDGVGYGSTFPFSWGIAFSGFSIIAAEKAWDTLRKEKAFSVLLFLLAFTSLLGAMNLYQLATPIVFLFVLIKIILNKEKKRFGFLFSYGALFCFTIVFYMLMTGFLSSHYGESVSSRGSLINSFSMLIGKISYFKGVFIQSTDQVAVSFLGNIAFNNIGRINVNLYLNNPGHEIILCAIIWVISLIPIIRFAVKTRRILDTIIILACVPFSYYCLLILQESSYVSYYAYPLAATIMFLFVYGLFCILDFIKGIILKVSRHDLKINISYFLVPVMILLMLQANLYVTNFWVNYNKNGYNYVKESIYNNKDVKWIHIYGVLYPGQGNIYSVFTADRALEELKADASQYKITTSDNIYYISIIQENDYKTIKEKLSENDAKFLDSIYLYDGTYGRYYMSRGNLTGDELKRLRNCFVVSDMIPEDNSSANIINLSWVNKT